MTTWDSGGAACGETTTGLSADEAYLVLEPYFAVIQDLFVAQGFELCRATRLYTAPNAHDTPRHFAATKTDGKTMLVAPEMAELPEETVGAIIAHEFGHATDFLYPGRFVLGPERVAVERERDAFTDAQWIRWLKDWEKRDDDVVEFTADAIAEYVTGRRIGYVGPCKLQAFDRGRARPQGLR